MLIYLKQQDLPSTNYMNNPVIITPKQILVENEGACILTAAFIGTSIWTTFFKPIRQNQPTIPAPIQQPPQLTQNQL